MSQIAGAKRKAINLTQDTDSDGYHSDAEYYHPAASYPNELGIEMQFVFYVLDQHCRISILNVKRQADDKIIIPKSKVAEMFTINIDDYAVMWAGIDCFANDDNLVINVQSNFDLVWDCLGNFTIGIYERRFVNFAMADDFTGIRSYLMEIYFDPHYRYRSKKAEWFTWKGVSHLELAAFSTNEAVFKALLDFGGYQSSKFLSDHLDQAAYIAASMGSISILDLLFDGGYDIKKEFRRGTFLDIACRHRRLSLVEFLLHHGLTVESTQECLHYAFRDPIDLSLAQKLIDAVADLNKQLPDGATSGNRPIHEAADAVDPTRNDAIQFLVDCGADIDARNYRGETSIHIAVQSYAYVKPFEIKKTVEMLLDNGADCRIKDYDGETAYSICKSREDMESITMLLYEEMSLRDNNFGFKR